MALSSPISPSCMSNLSSLPGAKRSSKTIVAGNQISNNFVSKIYPFRLPNPFFRVDFSLQSRRRNLSMTNIFASVTNADVLLDEAVEKSQLPKGDMWSIHKFGGTCVGTSDRIRNVAEIIVKDESERTLVVVSAMSKVTDMMYDLIHKAQSRDDSYVTALDAVLEKHLICLARMILQVSYPCCRMT